MSDTVSHAILRSTLSLLSLGAACDVRAQGLELMLPGDEYHRNDLPVDPSGTWWVLHRRTGEEGPTLVALPVVVTSFRTCGDEEPGEESGRAVSVPGVRDPILIVRGDVALRAGAVRTAFPDDGGGGGESRIVEAPWGDDVVVLRHEVEDPAGDQPGRYRIELALGDWRFTPHADQWHGDGHWRVRWIGDLNRDGWPDLLVDASYKYSVHTTRLFVSRETGGRPEYDQAAVLEHSSC